jgi:putative transposase
MSRLDYQLYYERNMPHVQPPGATLFLTSRLAGSLPHPVVLRLQDEARQRDEAIAKITDGKERDRLLDLAQRQIFAHWDAALDRATEGPFWLHQTKVAQLIASSMHYHDGKQYTLLAYCIMPNHLHWVCTPLIGQDELPISLARVNHSLKGYTAHKANDVLGRKGAFWQHESNDRWARDHDEVRRIILYVMNNPVKAGLVEHWDQWPWVYVRDLG